VPGETDPAMSEAAQLEEEGVRPRGGRLGERVVQGSKAHPERFPNAGGRNRKVDVKYWTGVRWRQRATLPASRARGVLEQYSRDRIKARAYDAMSGDLVGEVHQVQTRPGKPNKWSYWSAI
jgi:hypothetical protein